MAAPATPPVGSASELPRVAPEPPPDLERALPADGSATAQIDRATAAILRSVWFTIGVGGVLAVTTWFAAWSSAHRDLELAAKAATPWMQLIGVITGAIATALVARMNVLAAQRLELSKAEISKVVQAEIEDLKKRIIWQIETFKAMLPVRRAAYDGLFAAAHLLYVELARLDEGRWDAEAIGNSERRMEEAEALLPKVPTAYRQVWRDYWAESANVIDGLERVPESLASRRAYWAAKDKLLGKHMQRLEELGALPDD